MKIQNSQKGISALLIIVIIAIVTIAGGAYYAMSKKSSSSKSNTEMQKNNGESMSPTTVPSTVPSGAMMEAKTIEVSGQNFSFTPSTINVKQGEKVKVVFKDAQGTHNFMIEGMDVASKIIQTGQSDTVEFSADKKGTFKYYCSVGQHRKMGMEGTLIVE